MSAAEQLNQAMLEELRAIRAELRANRAELQAIRETSTHRALLTRQDAARLLGIDRHRLGRLVKAGLIRTTPDGETTKIAREEVERLARDGIPREPQKRGRPRKPLTRPSDAIRKLPLPPRPTGAS